MGGGGDTHPPAIGYLVIGMVEVDRLSASHWHGTWSAYEVQWKHAAADSVLVLCIRARAVQAHRCILSVAHRYSHRPNTI